MDFISMDEIVGPGESYSRKLDKEVLRSERPYGYIVSPPPADTHDFNQAKLEQGYRYRNG